MSAGRFDGRVAFVTGAASGIGRATAVRLATEGARVAVADLDLAGAERVAAGLPGPSGSGRAYGCDVTDTASVRRAIEDCAAWGGGLDVLVNNAGFGDGSPFAETSDDGFARSLDLNLLGALRCTQAALPFLLRSKGNVVSVGSVNGLAAFGDVAYSAAKAGLVLVMRNLTAEYGPRGVRFNVVAPGTIRTRVWEGREAALERLARTTYPLRRVGEPEDIAAAIAFLASDDASWISGIVLPVEGGVLSGPIAGHHLQSYAAESAESAESRATDSAS